MYHIYYDVCESVAVDNFNIHLPHNSYQINNLKINDSASKMKSTNRYSILLQMVSTYLFNSYGGLKVGPIKKYECSLILI